jgi:hypothetical protein
MTAVTSAAPHERSFEIARNQRTAHKSWERTFDRIVYFGRLEPDLASDKTAFVDSDSYPDIRSLVRFCSSVAGWSCIINADIVLIPIRFLAALSEVKRLGGKCAMSFRYQFDPVNPRIEPRVVDLGLDVFCAQQSVWEYILKTVPPFLRIGHCFWDTWMLGCFNVASAGKLYDFTPCRSVLHPKHGNRQAPHTIPTFTDPYSQAAGPVKLKARIDVDNSWPAIQCA